MAAAPGAQTFRWEAGNHSYDVAERAERVAEQARRTSSAALRNAERSWSATAQRPSRAR